MNKRKLLLFTLMAGIASFPAFALDLSPLSQDITVSSLPVPVDDETPPASASTNSASPTVMPQPQVTNTVATTPPAPSIASDKAPPPAAINAAPLPVPENAHPSIGDLYPSQNTTDATLQTPAGAPASAPNTPAPQTTAVSPYYDVNTDTAAMSPITAPVAESSSSAARPANAADAAMPATPASPAATENMPQNVASNAANNPESFTKLGSGNKIKIQVFGEEDLSGEFEIDANGNLSLPLIGTVQAAGLEPHALEDLITEKLKEGYLVNPLVSIEVLNYKPIFILGEVNKPGSYPYTTGLTVINAVALGGGFTNRARKGHVTIFRLNNGKKDELDGTESTLVYPGDTIRVDERWF